MPLDPKKAKRPWVMPWQETWTTAVAWLGKNRVAAGNKFGRILIWEIPDELPSKEDLEKSAKDEYAALPLEPVRMLAGHTNEIGALIASADGKRLFSCSYDHTLRVWDLSAPTEKTETIDLYDERGKKRAEKAGRTAEEIAPVEVPVQTVSQELKGHNPEWIREMDMNADKTRLFSGDDSGLAILWDTSTLQEITRVKGDAWIRGLALSPDAKQGVTTQYAIRYSTFSNHIRLWNLENGEESLALEEQVAGRRKSALPINTVAYSPDGKLLALGKGGEDGGGAIHLVDVAEKKKLKQLKGHQYGTTCVRFTADGKLLFSAGRDTLMMVWSIPDGKQVTELGKSRGGQFKDWIHDLDFNPDETRLAAADMAGMVHIWDFS